MTGSPFPSLLADIGGTNARFALATGPGTWIEEKVLPIRDFPGPAEAARAYLEQVINSPPAAPRHGAFCVACPVVGDRVTLTNHRAWSFSTADLADRLGFSKLSVVNDFVAQALAVPVLEPEHRRVLWEGRDRDEAPPGGPIGVIGPGTGLGVAILAPNGLGGYAAVPGEGGHVTLSATTDREAQLIAQARSIHGHVSAERFLSGPGLVTLATAIRAVDGWDPVDETPADIMTGALNGTCPVHGETASLFFAMLGTVAGNLALTCGAMGGIALMGGILPRAVEALAASPFLDRFHGKGRFRAYMERIPVTLTTHPYPAFHGLAALAESEG